MPGRLRIVYRPTWRERAGLAWSIFWRGVCRFAFRRLSIPHRQEPDGIPLRRSADDPCAGYSPRHFIGGDWLGCEGDGHYLCRECVHFSGEDEDDG